MNFKLFIYYCAVLGGWAALLAWGLCFLVGPADPEKTPSARVKVMLISSIVGALVAAAVGLVDAFLNAVGSQRLARTGICAGVGLLGGLIGGLLGQGIASALGFDSVVTRILGKTIGWVFVGVFIGGSIGVYDIMQAVSTRGDMRVPIKRTINGVLGGLLGGFLGGIVFAVFDSIGDPNNPMAGPLPVSKLAIGLVILGLLVGVLIALAQVFLKESWIRLDSGRRAGKEMMINKDEMVIGRAEGCDIGIFGEQGVERQHAKIILRNNQYYLEDNGTPGGTFLNDQKVMGQQPLRNGDKIQVGTAVLRFGEREKRR